MSKLVDVRYRVTVYVTVNLDTGEVVRVFEDDESARLDGSKRSAVEPSFHEDAEGLLDLHPLRAVQIAESAAWPAWER